MEEKQYFVHIIASKKYGTLYIGVTSNLVQRIYQHKKGLAEGITKKYSIHLSDGFPHTRERQKMSFPRRSERLELKHFVQNDHGYPHR